MSAQQRASWNPFTSLIVFDSGAGTRAMPDLHGVPVVEYPGATYSTIFHELTHLWCARTTRLGWFLSRAAAMAYAVWEQDPGSMVSLPDQVIRLLAAFTPILEGLALFAQLDYIVETGDEALSSPVALFSQITHLNLVHDVPSSQLFRAVREQALYAYQEQGQGLLELLMLDCRRGDQLHYFAGYLYVKAIARSLRLKSARFAKPGMCLPFMIRLLCDHPIIERALTGGLSERHILSALHATVTSLTASELESAGQLMASSRKLQERLDHWDLHRQLDAKQFSEPILISDDLKSPLFDIVDDASVGPHFTRLRACTGAHVLSWASGRLVSASESKFRLETTAGQQAVEWIAADKRLTFWYEDPPYPDWLEPPARLHVWYENELLMLEKLNRRLGQTLTFGLYYTLTKGSFGLSVWDETSWLGFLPFAPIRSENDPEFEIIVMALQLSPLQRSAFSQRIQIPLTVGLGIDLATEFILKQLISRPRMRQIIRAQKLRGVSRGRHITSLRQWCYPASNRTEPERLPAAVREDLDRAFDLPGFGRFPYDRKMRFSQLLPKLDAVVTAPAGGQQ